jgi:hypothetical protein
MSGANGLGRYINGRPNQNIFNVNRAATSIRTLLDDAFNFRRVCRVDLLHLVRPYLGRRHSDNVRIVGPV